MQGEAFHESKERGEPTPAMKILAVDLGDARTGLACCDSGELLAVPVGVLHERSRDRLLERIAAAVEEHAPAEIIVGYPKNMNNTVGERAKLCGEFADRLREKLGLPVHLWDERGTTVSAHNILNATDTRGKKRKAVVDAVAAVLILESYLASRRRTRDLE